MRSVQPEPAWIGEVLGGFGAKAGDIDYSAAWECVKTALANVGCTNFVIHFDEAQAWAATEAWERPAVDKRTLAVVPRAHYGRYHLVALTSAINGMATGSPFHFALSGTSRLIEDIGWGSCIKTSNYSLPYFSRDYVQEVLQKALKPAVFAVLPPDLFANLAGSPRVLQYFLCHVAERGLGLRRGVCVLGRMPHCPSQAHMLFCRPTWQAIWAKPES